MRRRLDPEKTREGVLRAATELFAERGFAGTSINDIAARAQVTKSLVLYHFGSKEALWQEAFSVKAQPLIQQMQRYVSGESGLKARDMLRFRFEFLQQHPEVGRMLVWLGLDSAPLPLQLAGFVPKVVAKVLEEYHGTLPVGEPALRTAIVLGAMDGWLQNRPLYAGIAGIGGQEGFDERFLDELLRLLPEEGA